jgi:hypothetical protein
LNLLLWPERTRYRGIEREEIGLRCQKRYCVRKLWRTSLLHVLILFLASYNYQVKQMASKLRRKFNFEFMN